MDWLNISEITKSYPPRVVLHPLSFAWRQGAKLGIMGESGSGKSTLMRIIAGLVQPDRGSVHLNGKRVPGPEEQLLPGHPGLAYLSQHFELYNNYVVSEIIEYGSKLESEEIMELCRHFEIDHLLSRKTNSGLSGGERQRIALVRQLSKKPDVLLLDEPFSNLDFMHRRAIQQILDEWVSSRSLTIIMSSHDPADLFPRTEEIIVLHQGRIVQKGHPTEIYFQPASAYVAGITGHYTLLPPSWLNEVSKYLPEIQTQNPVLARPESWKIHRDGTGIPATIVQKQFLGTHTLFTLECHALNILVNSPWYSGNTGEEVRLSFLVDRKHTCM